MIRAFVAADAGGLVSGCHAGDVDVGCRQQAVIAVFRFSVSRNHTDGDPCRGGGNAMCQCVALLSRADDADTVDDNQFGDLSGDEIPDRTQHFVGSQHLPATPETSSEAVAESVAWRVTIAGRVPVTVGGGRSAVAVDAESVICQRDIMPIR